MLSRVMETRSDRITSNMDEEASILIDSNVELFKKVKKNVTILEAINAVTFRLQTRNRTLEACREDVSSFIDDSGMGFNEARYEFIRMQNRK